MWKNEQNNGFVRVYQIRQDNTVLGVSDTGGKVQGIEDKTAKLMILKDGSITVDFNDGKLDHIRYSQENDTLQINHYMNKREYPKGNPSVTGVGTRLNKAR
jgi:hypothetical protein